MASEGSITRCIGSLKRGDPDAARILWHRYFRRLVGLARERLGAAPRRLADEEDIALSALDSVFRGARRGRFARLADRDDLWQLLGVIAARKAIDLVKHERALKRGGGGAAPGTDLDRLIGPGLSPELAAQVAEECQRRLDLLGDDKLRTVALRKLEGDTNDEIASQLGCDRRTVERKLRLIRTVWQKEPGP
jgi:DNA-directed RNA polymerase specialized sigma24 family protein